MILVPLVKLVGGVICLLPQPMAIGLGRFLGWIYGSVVRYHREDAEDAIARSMPDASPAQHRKWIRQMYSNLGLNVVEGLRLSSWSEEYLRENFEIENAELMLEASAKGNGVVCITGHIGNWELMSVAPRLLGLEGSIVVKPVKPEALNDYVVKQRAKMNLEVIPRRQVKPAIRALRKGKMLGMVMDQNTVRTEGVFVDFFGRSACTTPGAAVLSLQTGAPIVPIIMLRRDSKRHTIRFGPPIDPPRDRSPEAIHETTQACTKVLEEVIREHPEQWIWLHRRWKTRPEEEKI